jgi:hypothetical protein
MKWFSLYLVCSFFKFCLLTGVGARQLEIDVSELATSAYTNGKQWEYHFAEGDGGWLAALRLAATTGIKTIHFPAGVYHLTQPAYLDLFAIFGAAPFFWNGLHIYGDGIESTYFNSDTKLLGTAITFTTSSQSLILMGFKIHGFSLRVQSSEYALRLNMDPKARVMTNRMRSKDVDPKLEWNGSSLYDLYVMNEGSGLGAIYIHSWFSGYIQTLLAVVVSDQLARYNDIGAVVLDEVQYSLLDLRGLGSGTLGWALILQHYCYSNHFTMMHIEVAGGAMLFKGDGVGANQFSQVLISQVVNIQPSNSSLQSHNLIDSSNHSGLPIGHTYNKVFVNTMFQKFDSHWPSLGRSTTDLLCVDFNCANPISSL